VIPMVPQCSQFSPDCVEIEKRYAAGGAIASTPEIGKAAIYEGRRRTIEPPEPAGEIAITRTAEDYRHVLLGAGDK